MRRNWLFVGIVSIAIMAAMVLWMQRVLLLDWVRERSYHEMLPSPQLRTNFPTTVTSPPADAVVAVSSPTASGEFLLQPTREARVALRNINLAVPFAPQAPFANWDQPYQDACEEAAIIMVERYLRGAGITLAEMDREILRMVAFQNDHFGFYKDSNAAETALLIETLYPQLTTHVAYDVTADDIKEQLVLGNPVIVLVDGQLLDNPFYTQPGPERHALVIKGVTGDKFITNDPGTKRGADFVYSVATVMQALVDYDGRTPGTGKPAMIVVVPRSSS